MSDRAFPGPAAGPAPADGAPAAAAAIDALGWTDPSRRERFAEWLQREAPRHGLRPDTLAPASADASFRRYFRVQRSGAVGDDAPGSCIVMDAPPPLEDVRPFVDIAARLGRAGLHVPQVLACDAERGFLLLSDLGSELLLDALRRADPPQADRLMRGAVQALVQLQSQVDPAGLPRMDAALLQRELALFPEWCVRGEFGITWDAAQRAAWDRVCALLVDSALAQPVVAVHRDWMPRNLMVCEPFPGVLDFQDAVAGPVFYDVASLLRDAFLSWEEEQELDWAVRWWQQARRAGVPLGEDFGHDFGECWRAIEWMGLQRHLKVLGIFCRLKHRDGKPRYAADLPRFFAYANKVALRYGPLRPLLGLLEPMSGQRVQPGYTF